MITTVAIEDKPLYLDLSGLSDRDSTLLRLRYELSMTISEICDFLGIKAFTLKKRLKKAKRRAAIAWGIIDKKGRYL